MKATTGGSPSLRTQMCFGFLVAAADELEQARAIQSAADEGRSFRALQINVANLHAAERDPWLAERFRQADLLSAEGRGLYFASRLVGPRLASPVTGIGLMFRLLESASARGDRIYMLGAEVRVLADALAHVRQVYGDIVVGSHHGYFRTHTEQRQIATAIDTSGANIVLVGMSTPKKEAWIDRWSPRLALPLVGVGGSFDVLSGRTRLAPSWVRSGGLEWAYRLAQEPHRLWRRYLVSNGWFAAKLLRAYIAP